MSAQVQARLRIVLTALAIGLTLAASGCSSAPCGTTHDQRRDRHGDGEQARQRCIDDPGAHPHQAGGAFL
jgi:hypothetical protein